MTARLETIIRQKQLENAAAAIVSAHFPRDRAGAVNSMIVLKTETQVLCIDLKASSRPLSQRRLRQHAKLRRQGYRVMTCASVLEVQMALPRVSAAA